MIMFIFYLYLSLVYEWTFTFSRINLRQINVNVHFSTFTSLLKILLFHHFGPEKQILGSACAPGLQKMNAKNRKDFLYILTKNYLGRNLCRISPLTLIFLSKKISCNPKKDMVFSFKDAPYRTHLPEKAQNKKAHWISFKPRERYPVGHGIDLVL